MQVGDKAQWGTNIFQGRGDWAMDDTSWDGISTFFNVTLIIPFHPSFAWLYPALLKTGLLGLSEGIKIQNATMLKCV